MRPVAGAGDNKVNWLNYNTGIRHIYFRMDAGNNNATIAIELKHADETLRQHYFERLKQVKHLLEQSMGEAWDWQSRQKDEDGNIVSRISKTIEGVNIFNEPDWPTIISFLKPRMITLDEFWVMVNDGLE